jgi:hypothetical protein
MSRIRLIAATYLAVLSIAALTFVPAASAMQLFPSAKWVWSTPSVQASSEGFNPQEMIGAYPLTDARMLTVKVRSDAHTDRIAYRMYLNNDASGEHYQYARYDHVGETNVFVLPYESDRWSVAFDLLTADSTPSATNVSLTVNAR